MGVDYYRSLFLTRNASDHDIKKAYRKLSLKFHPAKNVDDFGASEKFAQIAEAYDVLSDVRKRAVYDQFGEEGLKSGVPVTGLELPSAWTDGYTFHGDADRVFREFFGGDNPFQEFYDRIHGDLSMGFGGLHGRGAKRKDPPIERELYLTLEEVNHGCLKKMKISRRAMNDDGVTSSIREKILMITVKKGWRPGTRIIFPEEGDQSPNNIPADIIFVVRDKPHDRFRREGLNLIYTPRISLCQALTNCIVEVRTLDGRMFNVPINDIICPGYSKTVPGEGMPDVENPETKGDLIITFDIDFPKFVSAESKELVRRAFNEITVE